MTWSPLDFLGERLLIQLKTKELLSDLKACVSTTKADFMTKRQRCKQGAIGFNNIGSIKIIFILLIK